MNARRFELSVPVIGSDVATPWPWSISTPAPVMMACPVCAGGGTAGADALRAIYQKAYEMAIAAVRPSRYQHSSLVSQN